ncbi:MAG: hypothetical protein ACTSQN_11465, partial [Candidatus Heimdallarchaeota archaeon]
MSKKENVEESKLSKKEKTTVIIVCIIIVLSSLALILYFNLDFNFNRISPLTTFDRIEITKD